MAKYLNTQYILFLNNENKVSFFLVYLLGFLGNTTKILN